MGQVVKESPWVKRLTLALELCNTCSDGVACSGLRWARLLSLGLVLEKVF